MFAEIGLNCPIHYDFTNMQNRLLEGFTSYFTWDAGGVRMHPAAQKVSEYCFFATSCDNAVKSEQLDHPYISKSTALIC